MTKTITVGVPIKMYADYERKTITGLLVHTLKNYNGGNICKKVDGKIVYMTIRLDEKYVDKIKTIADHHKITILECTSRMLGGSI